MAERLIERLIVKVSVQGAEKAKKSLEALSATIQQIENDAFEFNTQIRLIDKNLSKLSVTATEASKRLGSINLGFDSSGIANSLGNIEGLLETLTIEAVEMNESLTRVNNDLIKGFSFLAESLGVDLERIQDGLYDVGTEAQRASKKVETVAPAAERASRGLANMDRQGRNGARTFSSLARIAGPLPVLYAQIAANAFTLAEAFRLLSEGEQLNRLERVGTILGSQVGRPVQFIAQNMQELTGNTLNYGDALRQAAAASAYGFNSEQIEQLTMAARRASIALGVDMLDAMNRVVKGTSKLEIELLDELGITTKLELAYEKYARSIGVSAQSLNSYQQRAALVAEINRQSIEKFGILDEALRDGAPWEKFGANVTSASQKVLRSISEATAGIATFFNTIEEKNSKASRTLERNKALLDSYADAVDRAGRMGIYLEMSKELEQLTKQRDELVAEGPAKSWNILGDEARYKDQLHALNKAIQDTLDMMAKSDFGVPNLERAVTAQANLTAVTRGTVDAYDKTLTSIKGQSEAHIVLAQNINEMVAAYEELKASDPLADLNTALVKLQFNSEEALYKARELAEAYKDAKSFQDVISSTNSVNAELLRGSGMSALGIERVSIGRELAANEAMLEASRELGIEEAKLAGLYGKSAELRMQMLDIDIKRANEMADAMFLEQEINRAIGPSLLLTKDRLEIEKKRLEILKGIEGSQEAQEQSALRIRQIQNDINAARLQEYMGIMESSLSNLFSYGTGIDQLTNSLNKLSLSFNQVGETSMTAMQMTGVGLQAFQGMLAYTSAQTVSSIEAQIAAEQKRDGKSKESLARIKSLEEKKIREQKKAAQQQILISTAVAVMSAAANPWPLPAIPLMAAAALAGGLAYAQASSASANQLAGLNEAGLSQASLTVGNRENNIDVSKNASMGELAFIRGERGVGSANSFSPRAAGGTGTPYSSLIVGENGPERITPLSPINIERAEDSTSSATRSSTAMIGQMVIQALDAQSVIDRATEIYEAVNHEAKRRGQSLDRLS
ncbi:tail length tape-measure protein [Vibrio phage JSF12]|uniref:Tail length tape-measure protein n=2 Tax=Jesfedecavirus TaxID=2560156 RepID=A0A2D0Z6C6_9CAUD|nr:tail length tape measure protein [Vibrio phage JSF10]YP_009794799.1 tail length tape measure protein [Vibrio phage JSF12]ASV43465.1 tail length tape-measure protein [Vibrio phage JSF10]ASV43634.1 tail length tape-measure protein [Vibrio phage JSF12]